MSMSYGLPPASHIQFGEVDQEKLKTKQFFNPTADFVLTVLLWQ